jgi:hypothetical protein
MALDGFVVVVDSCTFCASSRLSTSCSAACSSRYSNCCRTVSRLRSMINGRDDDLSTTFSILYLYNASRKMRKAGSQNQRNKARCESHGPRWIAGCKRATTGHRHSVVTMYQAGGCGRAACKLDSRRSTREIASPRYRLLLCNIFW